MGGTRAALLLAVLLSFTACGGSGSNTGTVVTPTAAKGPTVFAVGQVIKVGDNLLFTVTSVQAPFDSGNEFETATKGQYLAVAVSLQNNGSKEVRIYSPVSFSLRDGTGQTYDETIVSSAHNPPDGPIAPGDKLAGTLVYDVPKGQDFRLYFTLNVFSSSGGGVIVDLGIH